MSKLLDSFGRTRTFLDNANYVVYRKKTAGSWSYTIPETRLYYIDLVGGGAGGWGVHRHRANPNDSFVYLPFGGGGSGWSVFGPFYLTKGTVISGTVGAGGAAKTDDLVSSTPAGTYTGNNGGQSTATISGTQYVQAGGIAGKVVVVSSDAYGSWTNGQGSTGNKTNGNNGTRGTTTGTGGASVLENAGTGGDASTPVGGTMSATNGVAGIVRVRVA